MLARLNTDELRNIARLTTEEFVLLRGVLTRELELTRDALVDSAEGQMASRLQGKARFLQDFMALMEKSRELI